MNLEYSFNLHTANLGEKYREGKNPFTGEVIRFPIDLGLTDLEKATLKRIFRENGINGPEDDGEGYAGYFEHNQSIRFRCNLNNDEPINGIAVEVIVKELSETILSIIIELSKQSKLVLTSSIGDCVSMFSQPDNRHIERWGHIQIIETASDLAVWLNNEIGSRDVAAL